MNLHFVVKKKVYTYPNIEGVGAALDTDFKALYGEFCVVILNAAGGRTPLKGSTYVQENRRLRDTVPDLGSPPIQSIQTKDIRFTLVFLSGLPFLFLAPEVAAAQLELTYYAWLPDYLADEDTDVLLERGYDALLWESVKVANMRLMEEDRVQIDQALASQALTSLQEWARGLTISGATLDLV
jgi:hypothetical protein